MINDEMDQTVGSPVDHHNLHYSTSSLSKIGLQ